VRDSKRPRLTAKQQQSLLSWFDANRRELPWRASRDPYRIWVSEVMLQQTTVAAVIPYFERFLTAFPTVRELARVEEARVLKLWEGLGYYRRARHLHAAARILVAEHCGLLPDDPAVWQALPGVGRYIHGAVLSQAFDRRLPIVEANSMRVLARLFGRRDDPRDGEGKAWLWRTAAAMLPATRAGDFNQALMELGALVCTPVAPNCAACPLRAKCAAYRDGLQERIPPRKKPAAITRVREVAVVIRRKDMILLCRRPATSSRWQNMWEVPHAERHAMEPTAVAATRVARELTGLEIEPDAAAMTIRHSVTRFRITMECVEASVRRGRFRPGAYPAGRWVRPAEAANYPISTPMRKLLAQLG
jgi:A/G-specific adenine glycosylase